ncbi:MAG: hypothetical protein O3A00_00055 [Planctomycetota bacterium]|nr:hypothetical protein [Planctomycetota bacterium]
MGTYNEFDLGAWSLQVVADRIDTEYVGGVVTVELSGDIIETTAGHPFWVVSGVGLEHRGIPAELQQGEDEGRALKTNG